MSLEHAILGFLNTRARSGYDLKTRCFDVEAKAFWTADQAQIYRTLERLKTARLVNATRTPPVRQARSQALRDHACRTRRLRAMGDHRSAPLGPHGTPSCFRSTSQERRQTTRSLTLLSSRRADHQARLEGLRAEAIELSRDHTLPARVAAMRQAAYDGAMATERATIDWLDDILEAISDGLLPGSENSSPGTQNPLFGWAPA